MISLISLICFPNIRRDHVYAHVVSFCIYLDSDSFYYFVSVEHRKWCEMKQDVPKVKAVSFNLRVCWKILDELVWNWSNCLGQRARCVTGNI